jgi:hypothetical protein
LPTSQPAMTTTVSATPRVTTAPIAGTAARATRIAVGGTPRVPQSGTGSGNGTSGRIWIALLAAGVVAIGVTGSFLAYRWLAGRRS